MNQNAIPYWRLSGFYFFYFALAGTLMPFFGLYLQSLSFSPQQIGTLSAILMATKIVAPNIWGWLSDKTGRRLSIIRWGCFLAALFFLILLWRQSFAWLAFAIFCYSFFWNAVLAQFEVVTLGYLTQRPHAYSRIRLWGSVGFVMAVMGFGALFDVFSIAYLPWLALFLLLLIWFSSLSLREEKVIAREVKQGQFLKQLQQRPVLFFLLCSFLLQLSHGTYYTFYSVYLEALGYSRTVIGALWALGVVAEIGVFLVMHQWMQRAGLRAILLITLALTCLRWSFIALFSDVLVMLLFAQLLHAFSFGSAHAVAIEFIRRYFQGGTQGQGQALYSAVGFGAGGAVGALLSGWLWPINPLFAFLLSGLSALLAMLCVWFGLEKTEARDSKGV